MSDDLASIRSCIDHMTAIMDDVLNLERVLKAGRSPTILNLPRLLKSMEATCTHQAAPGVKVQLNIEKLKVLSKNIFKNGLGCRSIESPDLSSCILLIFVIFCFRSMSVT